MARKAYNIEMAMENPEEVEELYLHSLNLRLFPEKIFHLKNLKKLYLSGNRLTQIPKAFAILNKLKEIVFHNNLLTESSFTYFIETDFPKLEILNLSQNNITNVPPHLFRFKNLRNLDISRNKIEKISPNINQLKELTSLNISSNLISNLPEEIGELEKLSRLHLYMNQIQFLPKSFSQLRNLTVLELQRNPLKELPQGFEKLTNLSRLQLSINDKFLTNQLSKKLCGLKTLILKGDGKMAIPDNVFQIYNIEYLTLTDFGASTINSSIGELQKLRKLVINRSHLKYLSNTFGDLSSLEYFILLGSKLNQLPSSLVNLKKLRKFKIDKKFNESEVNRFLKKIKIENFPRYLKEAAFDFIFSKENSLKKLSKKDLLILAQFPFQNLGKAVTNLLCQNYSLNIVQRPLSKNTHLAILGNTNLNLKKLQPHLKNISKKITPQTTHIILGKCPGEIENLASRDFIFVRESELNRWLQTQEQPYLFSSSKEEIENLSRLLLSLQPENIDIALQIMESGGVPESILTDLVITFKKLAPCKQKRAIRKLLAINLSEEALKVVSLKTGLLKQADLSLKIKALTKGTELDGEKIAATLLNKNP